MSVQPERKKRKWDVAVDGSTVTPPALASLPASFKPGQGLDAEAIKRAQEAATAVLNKFTQENAARGIVSVGKFAVDVKEVTREVTINDAPASVRYNLTKRSTQDDIQRRTGTLIVTRGRYYPPGVAVDEKEKPLHLLIKPGADAGQTDQEKQKAIDAAAAEIQRIMEGGKLSATTGPSGFQQHQAALSHSTVSTQPQILYVDFVAPPEFQLSHHIRGPDGSYLSHIAKSTGATVQLRGRGSLVAESPEPLHLYIVGPTQKAIEDAKSLGQDLLQTVRKEVEKSYPHGFSSPAAPTTYAPAPYAAAPYGMAPPMPYPGYPPPYAPGYPPGYLPQQRPLAPPTSGPLGVAPSQAAVAYPFSYPAYAPPPAMNGTSYPSTTQAPYPAPYYNAAAMPHMAPGYPPPYPYATPYPAMPQPVAQVQQQSNDSSEPAEAQVAGDKSPPRRKFREFKESSPPPSGQVLPPPASTSENGFDSSGVYSHYSVPGSMGPPPPRLPQGHNAAPPSSGAARIIDGSSSGVGGLVDYDGDD